MICMNYYNMYIYHVHIHMYIYTYDVDHTVLFLCSKDPVPYYVTRPEKTSLIYTKYTYSYYGIYLFVCVCYTKSVSLIEFLRKFCEICIKILC